MKELWYVIFIQSGDDKRYDCIVMYLYNIFVEILLLIVIGEVGFMRWLYIEVNDFLNESNVFMK